MAPSTSKNAVAKPAKAKARRTTANASKKLSVAKPAPKPTTKRSRNVQAQFDAVGRRKSAVARVRLTPGKGTITVNGKTMQEYFPEADWQTNLTAPLTLVGQRKSVDISVLARGGGVTGQADAARLGIARALQKMDPDYRSSLKKAGFLRRDPREKERKKYGLKGARRAPQFSKR